MAISKKGKVDFLTGIDAENINNQSTEDVEVMGKKSKTQKADKSKKGKKDKKDGKKKESKGAGRPRKSLIDGEKEKSITVQLPKSLIKALRKLAKQNKKSMKEVIGEALLEKYKDILK